MVYLNPATWLSLVSSLPRPSAALVCVVCLSLLALGLRAFHYYVCLALALAAFFAGTKLAKLMVVRDLYVALPAALVGFAVGWPLSKRLAVGLIGIASAACLARFVTVGLDYREHYWTAFAGGACLGIALALVAPRFATAMFAAGVGAAGIVASVGSVVRADQGPLSPGGYAAYPLPFVIAGTVLFLAGVVLQAVFDRDAEPKLAMGAA